MSIRSNLNKQKNTPKRIYALSLLGAAILGICILFASAFVWFQPDQLSLSDRYFPSSTPTLTPTSTLTPTPTSTPTPTFTSTPNITATQQAIQATSTSRAIQTTIANVDSQWNILFSDGFDTDKGHWVVGDDDGEYATIVREIENGVYKWDITAKKGFIGWISAYTKSVSDFFLTVEAQQTDGSRSSNFGLIFREDTKSNFYYFGIDKDGFFVSLHYNDKWIDVIDFTSSSAILPASPNRLTVIASGSHFTFLINDQFVANATDDRISRGTTALAIELHRADLQATFEFDSFELREP